MDKLEIIKKRGLSLSSSDIVIGMIVVLISWVIDAGRDIMEKQKFTV